MCLVDKGSFARHWYMKMKRKIYISKSIYVNSGVKFYIHEREYHFVKITIFTCIKTKKKKSIVML